MRRLLLLMLIALFIVPANAQEDVVTIPEADWLAVVWMPESDTLHWLTATGKVAELPRPMLPAEDPQSTPRMRVSPDGKTLLLVSLLQDGTTGIGFFDLESGAWLQTHAAQPGERVALGRHIERGNHVALGFDTPDTGAWRIITFDYATGQAVDQLQSADPIAVIVPAAPPVKTPYVVDYGLDPATNAEVIHFHFTDETATPLAGAFAWYPDEGTLAPSPYSQVSGDFLYSTGDYAFVFTNRAYPLPPVDPNTATTESGNAVGHGDLLNPTTIFADGMTVKSHPRWLAGGAWIAYYAQSTESAFWQIVPVTTSGDTIMQVSLVPTVREVVGTPDGFLAFREDGSITFTADFNAPDGSPIFPPSAEMPVLVGVTPEGVRPALTQVQAPQTITANTEAPADAIQACEGTPPTRLQVGMTAQVVGTVPLRVRNAPGGAYLDDMPLGAQVLITESAACVNGYLWWGVRYEAEGRVLEGWSAEGDLDEYYLEPVTLDPTATPTAAVTPTMTTPPTLSDAPFAPPTVTPGT